MGLLGKIFGKSDGLSKLRKAVADQRWADALIFAETAQKVGEDALLSEEIASLARIARENLAVINLEEGEACLRAGNFARAEEHFSLAREQALSVELIDRIDMARLGTGAHLASPGNNSDESSCGCESSCHSSRVVTALVDPASNIGRDEAFRLLLETYPPELRALYLECSPDFIGAFMLSHEGNDRDALTLLDEIPEHLRNDLFFFERGGVLCRLGRQLEGRQDIEHALSIRPDNRYALEMLVDIEIECGELEAAETRLDRILSETGGDGFVHSRLASLFSLRGLFEEALKHGLLSLDKNPADQQMLLLCASILERNGRDDEAEALLLRLSGHGCSSGISLPLAEFSLRNGKRLDKTLEAFKNALRSDSENPRWVVRIAQVYLSMGWKKEGIELLKQVHGHPALDAELREVVAAGLGETSSCSPAWH